MSANERRAQRPTERIFPAPVCFALAVVLLPAWASSQQSPPEQPNHLPREGKSLTLNLVPGQTVRLEISLRADDLLQVEVEQRGVDVEVEIVESVEADGATWWRTNLHPRGHGTETAFALMDRDTQAAVLVRAVGKRAGVAQVRTVRLGTVTETERLAYAAEKALQSTRVSRADRGATVVTDDWVQRALDSAETFEDLGAPERAAEALRHVGTLKILQDKPLEAVPHLDRGIVLARRSGDRMAECRLYLTRAEVVYERSVEEAVADERTVVERFSETEQASCVLSAFRLLIYDLHHLGRFDEAIELFHRALPVADRLQDPWSRAGLHQNVGAAFLSTGDYSRAIQAFTEAKTGYASSGDQRSSMLALDNLTRVYSALGAIEGQLQAKREVVAFLRGHAEPGELESALTSLAELYVEVGDATRGRRAFEEALAQESSSAVQRATAQVRYAQALLDWKRFDEARALIVDAQQAYQGLGDVRGLLHADVLDGQLQAATGEQGEAVVRLRAAADRAQDLRLFPLEFDIRQRLAELLWSLGDRAAGQEIARAIEIVEGSRAGLSTLATLTSQSARLRSAYDQAIGIRLADSERRAGPQELFLLAERARSRALQELLSDSRAEAVRSLDPALLQEEQKTLADLSRLSSERRREAPGTAARRRLDRAIVDAEAKLDGLAVQRLDGDSRRASMFDGQTANLEQIRNALAGRPLLSYHLQGDTVLLFVVRPDTIELHVVEDAEGLQTLVQRVDRAARQRSAFVGSFASAATALHRALLSPAQLEPTETEIVISPDGWLHRLPFEALLTRSVQQGETWRDLPYLLRQHAVSYTPSASVLAVLHTNANRDDDGSLLALGDPALSREPRPASEARSGHLDALPHARAEVEAIAALGAMNGEATRGPSSRPHAPTRARTAVGSAATESLLRSDAGVRARYLHLSVHGVLDEELSGQSRLVLAADPRHDGQLHLHEITRLRLAAELVTLSACDTAAGSEVRGEGLISLARGFLFAGAQSLLASQWQISDEATVGLMTHFYHRLFSGAGRAASLRNAKLQTLDHVPTSHPYYWAPFVLYGESR